MSSYIHGSTPEEQSRLSLLNDLINERCLKLIDLQPGNRILDIGSGLGQFTLAMAARVGDTGMCIGIERDKNQLKTAEVNRKKSGTNRIEFREGNAEALELKPNEWGTFNLAHTRFVLEHVQKPEDIIASMVKAVVSGGKVIVADDDHDNFHLDPEPPGFSVVWSAYLRSYLNLGNDPFIGRRLVRLLHQGGLKNIRNEVVFMGDSADQSTFQAYVANIIGILEGSKGYMVQEKLIDTIAFTQAITNLRKWAERPDASLWYVINWAEGVKP